MSGEPAALGTTTRVAYVPRGASLAMMNSRSEYLMLAGPAGTGKSRGMLEKLHLVLSKYPNARGLIVRKTLQSLTSTGLVTYRQHVLHPQDGVIFFGGNKQESASFQYPNGSRLIVGGLDNITKIMSGEYDIIYVQEATEVSLSDWESLTTRLRNGKVPYQQILGDCNPDAPHHWIKRHADAGKILMLDSRHEDNPTLYDHETKQWTERGAKYMQKLNNLSGVRLQRLRYGRWVAAEGVVYEEFDHNLHVIDRFPIPKDWRRIRSIDFGYTNPFVTLWFAIDPDGRMYLYRELYRTQRLVEEHAQDILRLSAGERIEATVADHDAEDRATLHKHGIKTVPARKNISVGIQAVQKRLQRAGDGKPRLFLMRDSLVSKDESLVDEGSPTCLDQEMDVYVWPPSIDGRVSKEVPMDAANHAEDCLRYSVMYVDHMRKRVAPFSMEQISKWRS